MSAKRKEEHEEPRPPRRRKRWRRWLVGLLLMLVIFGAWANGPGMRWLAPKAAHRLLGKAGLETAFELGGSLLGGLELKDVEVRSRRSGSKVTLGHAKIDYSPSSLFGRRVDLIEVDGLHVDMNLKPRDKSEEKPLELAKIGEIYAKARPLLKSAKIDIRNVSISAIKDDERVFAIEPSGLQHAPGSDNFVLSLGKMNIAKLDEVAAQNVEAELADEKIMLSTVNLLPDIAIRSALLNLPLNEQTAGEIGLDLCGGQVEVIIKQGSEEVLIEMREGAMDIGKLLASVGNTLPVQGKVTSLAGTVAGFVPNAGQLNGELRVLVDDLAVAGLQIPEIALDANLVGEAANVQGKGRALGSEFAFDAVAAVTRGEKKITFGNISGNYQLMDVRSFLAELGEKVAVLSSEARVPLSTAGGSFRISKTVDRLDGAEFVLELAPQNEEQAAAVRVRANYVPDAKQVLCNLETEGFKGEMEVLVPSTDYKGQARIENFHSVRIAPWLKALEKPISGELDATAIWSGRGNLVRRSHWGDLSISSSELRREKMPALKATGDIKYKTPDELEVMGLKLAAAKQRVSLDAKLVDGNLDVSQVEWVDGEQKLLDGHAKVPIPKNFKEWKQALRSETRPVDIHLNSAEIAFAHFNDWFASAKLLDGQSMVQLNVNAVGPMADPEIDLTLKAWNLKATDQPKLPPAKVELAFQTKAGRATLQGKAEAQDYPPATISASMPFELAEWADDVEKLKATPINGKAEFPRLELSRFLSLAPGLKKLEGTITGNADVSGTIGKPVMKAHLELNRGAVAMQNAATPPIDALEVVIDADETQVALQKLQASVASGKLQGSGRISLDRWKPQTVDLRLLGDHLGALRNDSIIARANADLRISGPWQRATVGGEVRVVDSLFYRDIELLPVGSPIATAKPTSLPKLGSASRQLVLPIPPPFADWLMDVKVRTENPFLIRGNLATGSVTMDVKVAGTLARPAPSGDVSISDFKALLPFSTLRIKQGVVKLDPQAALDPVLEIRGTAEPRPYKVRAFVYGRLSDPKLVLTSSPPLPENEIMTLLATGTTPSGLENPEMAANRAVQLFAEEVRRGRVPGSKRLRPVLGLLDRVDFALSESDPYSADSYSSATVRITDHWYYSIGMTSEGYTRSLAIWKLVFR